MSSDKRIIHDLLIFLVLAAFAFPAASIRAEEALELTLQGALELARENNPNILQALERVESAEAGVNGAVGGFLPELSVSGSGYRQYYKADGGTDPFEDDYDALNVALSGSLTVFDGLGNVANLKRANLERSEEHLQEEWDTQSVSYEVAIRFFEVLKSRELALVEEENLKQNQQLLEKIEVYHASGKVPVTDLYQQKAEMSQAEKRLLDAKSNLEVNRLLFAQTLGIPPTTPLRVVPTGFSIDQPDAGSLSSGKLLAGALENRADLLALEAAEDARAQDVRQAQSGYWPQVDLYASLSSGYSTSFDDASFSDQFMEDQAVGQVGVSLSVPIFDGLKTRTAAKQAKIQKRLAELETEKIRRQAAVELGQSVEEYRTAFQQVQVAAMQQEAAWMALSAMEERYRVGTSTMLELTSARNTYLEAQYDKVETGYDLIDKRLAVSLYEGSLMETLMQLTKGESK